MTPLSEKPIIGLTMGDAAGIGPEVVVRAAADERVRGWCRPVAFGRPELLQRAAGRTQAAVDIVPVASIAKVADFPADRLPCVSVGLNDVLEVAAGVVDPRAGRAAYDAVVTAGNAALRGEIDAVVTAPLNKAALNRAAIRVPGHTELLAKLCGVGRYAMMLYMPRGEGIQSSNGLCIAHVTLHTSIASVPGLLTTDGLREKIELVDAFLNDIAAKQRRIAVCALNPHAGEDGLFGDEEQTLIAPAVAAARESGCNVVGPFPADTLIRRAVAGEFDGLVAMYHDQGHIAFKLLGFNRAVNITLGLPIIRTSPSHGTAFDIAWRGVADPAGMIEAIRIAALLAARRSEFRGDS